MSSRTDFPPSPSDEPSMARQRAKEPRSPSVAIVPASIASASVNLPAATLRRVSVPPCLLGLDQRQDPAGLRPRPLRPARGINPRQRGTRKSPCARAPLLAQETIAVLPSPSPGGFLLLNVGRPEA